MKRFILAAAAGLLVLSLAGPVSAGVIRQREQRQQERIREGVRSGSLTPGETRRLERRQFRIERERRAALRDGRMGPAERRHIRHMQDRESRDIYRLRHNPRVRR